MPTALETPGNSMNTTALKALVAESEKNLQSYRLTLAQDQYIERSNLTGYGSSNQVRALTFGAGAFNLTGTAAKMVIESLSQPIGQEENATAAAAKVYILNDTIYTRADGNWTSLTLPLPREHLENPGPARPIGRADE